MIISNIKESGSNNILKWAINNGADIKNDIQLQSIINDETFYIVQIDDVNFFELFRLSQMYREKLRIVDEKKYDLPPRKELFQLFNGHHIPDPENKPDEKVPLHELVEYSCQQFINLALQMNSDSDIIRPETVRLFFPMICRRFDVQIPVSFMDIVGTIPDEDQTRKLFNSEYPDNLNQYVIESENNVKNLLYIGLMKSTSIIRYDDHYDQLLKVTKYSPLKKVNTNKLWKARMSGFFKYDNISRGEVRCSLFQPNKITVADNLKRMSRIKTPLKVDFVVQMPLQYMQILLNSFSREELNITYESSMSAIIDSGIHFNDFISHEWDENTENEEEKNAILQYNNAIETYQNRINEVNNIVLNTIPIMLTNDGDVDVTATFAMLPAIYSAKAVITINMQYADKYMRHFDPTIVEMFQELLEVCESIQEDINKSK